MTRRRFPPVPASEGVRAAVEGIPLQPGMPPLRSARALLDAGSLRTVDIKAVRGSSARSKGEAVSTFYMEYDAPPYVAVAVVPHQGALYVVHASMPSSSSSSSEGGRREAGMLRSIVDSFEVG